MGSGRQTLEFRPFRHPSDDCEDHGRDFSPRREPRVVARAKVRPRSDQQSTLALYGQRFFVSLVDQHEAPFPEALRHICADALCTNRDLAADAAR